MNERYINYYCKQKMWWCTMDNVTIDYRHKSESNDMYLIHMVTPKQQIDRIGYYPKNWRWHNE